MEKIGTSPVKDRHKIITDDLYTELAQVADALLIVLDVHIPGGKADLDVVMDIDGFYNIDVEAVCLALLLHLSNFFFLPNFTGHLVMQGPDNAGYAGDLLDVGQLDFVVAFAVPTETHLHWHK